MKHVIFDDKRIVFIKVKFVSDKTCFVKSELKDNNENCKQDLSKKCKIVLFYMYFIVHVLKTKENKVVVYKNTASSALFLIFINV